MGTHPIRRKCAVRELLLAILICAVGPLCGGSSAVLAELPGTGSFWLKRTDGLQPGEMPSATTLGYTRYLFSLDGEGSTLEESGDWAAILTADAFLSDVGSGGGNFGVHYRQHVGAATIGAGLWYDTTQSPQNKVFQQLGLTFDAFNNDWTIRVNGYAPVGPSSRATNSPVTTGTPTGVLGLRGTVVGSGLRTTQQVDMALAGAEVQVWRSVLHGRAEVGAGYYFWDGELDEQAHGMMAGVRGGLTDRLSAEVAVANDDYFGTNVFGSVTFYFDRLYPGSTSRRNSLFRPVQRNTQIAVRHFNYLVSDEFTPIVDANTGRPIRLFVAEEGGTGNGTVDTPSNIADILNEPDFDAGSTLLLVDNGGPITTPITLNADRQQVIGGGNSGVATIDFSTATGSAGDVLTLTGLGSRPILAPASTNAIELTDQNTIAGFTIDGNGGATNGIVGTPGAVDTTVNDMLLQGLSGTAIDIRPSTNTTISNVAFVNNGQDIVLNAANTTITNVTSDGSIGTAIRLANATGITTIADVSITNAGGDAIVFENAGGSVNVDNLDIIRPAGTGIVINGGGADFNFDADTSITSLNNTSFSLTDSTASVSYFGTILQQWEVLPDIFDPGVFTPGNIVVLNDPYGPATFYEFTPEGELVQTIAFTQGGDLAFDEQGRVQVYDEYKIRTYDPVTGQETYADIPGMNVVGNITYGALDSYKNFVFATDMATSGAGAPRGLVRVNTDNPSEYIRFGDIDPFDVNVGQDGLVYALSRGNAINGGGTHISVFDPDTLNLVRAFHLPDEVRAIAVVENGDIYAAQRNPLQSVRHYDSAGTRLDILETPDFGGQADIDISSDGQAIVVTSHGGAYLQLDANLNPLRVVMSAPSNNTTFSTFVQPPIGAATPVSDDTHPLVEIRNHSTGTVAFGGGSLTAEAGTGLQFENADGTYNFNSTVTLDGGDAGIDIDGDSAGSFTFADTTVNDPSGTAFSVVDSAPNVTFHGTISQGSDSARVLEINHLLGGTLQFNGLLQGTQGSSGVMLQNCVGGSVTIDDLQLGSALQPLNANALTIQNNTGGTFAIENAGIFTNDGIGFVAANNTNTAGIYTGATTTITGTGETAVLISNAGPGVLDLNFDSITCNDPGAGNAGILIVGAGGSFNAESVNVSNSILPAVHVANSDDFTADFGTTTITGATAGVELAGNSNSTFHFSALDIENTGDTGLFVYRSGTLQIDGGSIDTTDSVGTDIQQTSLDVTLDDVTVTNTPSSAVILDRINGQFSVTGDTVSTNVVASGFASQTPIIGITNISDPATEISFSAVTSTHRIAFDGIHIENAAGTFNFGDVVLSNPDTSGGGSGYQIYLRNSTADMTFQSINMPQRLRAGIVAIDYHGDFEVAGDTFIQTGADAQGDSFAVSVAGDNKSTGNFTFADFTVVNSPLHQAFSPNGILINESVGTILFNGTTTIVRSRGSAIEIKRASPTVRFNDVECIDGEYGAITLGSLEGGTIEFGDTYIYTNAGNTPSIGGAAIRFSNSTADVTMASLMIDNVNSQGIRSIYSDGSFTVTGTTSITNAAGEAIIVRDSDADHSFGNVNIENITGSGIYLDDARGTFVVTNGGTIHDVTQNGVEAISANQISLNSLTIDQVGADAINLQDVTNFTLNDSTFSHVADDVLDLSGTLTIAGSGNSYDAGTVTNFHETTGATITGSIDFGAQGTCP